MGDFHNRKDLALIYLGINLAYSSGGVDNPLAAARASTLLIRDVVESSNDLQRKNFEGAYDCVDAVLNVIDNENKAGEFKGKKEEVKESSIIKIN